MVRPIKHPKGWSQWNIMRFRRATEVYEKAEELAKRENTSVSEIVLKALVEYLDLHYPGQPIPPLESFAFNGLKAVRLEGRFVAREVSKFLKKLVNGNVSDNYKREIKLRHLPKKLIKLARLNQRIRNEEYGELIARGEKELE